MNDRISGKVKCPFYISHNSTGRNNNITITCELIQSNMGFDVKNLLSFNDGRQRKDYMEIFCMDVFEGCPYYQCIVNNKYRSDT